MENKELMSEWKKNSIRIGTPTNLLAAFTSFIPVIWLCITYNCWPDPKVVLAGWGMVALSFGAFYVVEPISYYAALGLTGTYLSFLSGNIGNMRVPCATMALETTESEPGTLQAEVASTMAICGSTNAVLHLSAIANEAELDMNVVEEFRALNKTTPQIAKVNPAAKWDMEAFYRAGGIPRVMDHLGELLDTESMTCTGKTISENLKEYTYSYPENPEIIKTVEEPFSTTGGVAVLDGNLAPHTAISKPGAIDPALHRFTGKAKCYNSEEEAEEAILGGKIEKGDVVVIRYEGPKGGPGMREMFKAMKYMYGMGLAKSAALITDGRFSGTNNGCFVGHISPEAAEGGPLAIVEDGDEISIDVIDGKLELHVSDEEIERRKKAWVRPEKPIPNGYLRLYSKVASSADKGAIIEC